MTAVPAVSVAIPVFDQLNSLKIVLRFFNYQRYPTDRLEVVIVDDGSSEPVYDALEATRYAYRLIVYRQPNSGRAAARNRAVERATGDVILFCDADRIPDPDFVAAHVRFQLQHPGAAAFGCPWDCFYGTRKLQASTDLDIATIRRFSRQPEYYRAVSQLFADGVTSSKIAWLAFLVGNSSIRKRDLEEVGGFDERFRAWGLEHFELALRLQENGTPLCHNAAAASYHIPHVRDPISLASSLRASMAVMSELHPGANTAALERFLLGDLSLQDVELEVAGSASGSLPADPPLHVGRLFAGHAGHDEENPALKR
jgi:GT2 family glycosyltransferase